jgi:steroid 5-alpha reductase family enzyme
MKELPQRTDIQPYEIWAPIISVFIANIVLYFVAQLLKDNSIADITWGIMHVIPNAVIWIINKNTTESSIAANVLILVWALRMAIYNIARHKSEDWRFS